MIQKFRNSFVTGLLLVAPLAATVWVVNFTATTLGRPARKMVLDFLHLELQDNAFIEFGLNLLGILIIVVLITLLGYFSKYVLGKFMVSMGERIIEIVPFVNTVYRTVKQIVETFSQQNKAVFQKVVMTEYPRKGVYVIGFLTSSAKGEVQGRTGEEVVNIFVPTTPNPTSGFLLMVPRSEIQILDMSIGEGMKLIISGGAVVPTWTPELNPGEPSPATMQNTLLNRPGKSNEPPS